MDFASQFSRKLPHHVLGKLDVAICPTSAHLSLLTAKGALPVAVSVGAQDSHWEAKGAFTGCVSAPMLKDLKARYVIVGHSERRRDFGESEKMLAGKIKSVLSVGLIPVYCVGERLEEREKGAAFKVLERQTGALAQIAVDSFRDPGNFVLAYEPVWAIGTGKNASSQEAQEAHQHLRGLLAKHWGAEVAAGVRILYGGSVTPENFASLLQCGDVDGGLVGGASLDADSFLKLIQIAVES